MKESFRWHLHPQNLHPRRRVCWHLHPQNRRFILWKLWDDALQFSSKVIKNEIVVDKRTSLLRSITLIDTNASATTRYRCFSVLQWKTVAKSSFPSILVSLQNETGSLVPLLTCGRTTLTLKFRHFQ